MHQKFTKSERSATPKVGQDSPQPLSPNSSPNLSKTLPQTLPQTLPKTLPKFLARSLQQLESGDAGARAEAQAREAQLTKPEGSLGRLESLSAHLAYWQRRARPRLKRVQVLVFAANHGITEQGVSPYPREVTAQMVENFRNRGAAVNQLCKVSRAELVVEAFPLDRPTKNFFHENAMTSQECAFAVERGASFVGRDLDLLCLGEMGIGNTTSAAAMLYALYGGTARDWTGKGTGGDRAAKICVVEDSLDRFVRENNPLRMGWESLCAFGGFELAAIVGAIVQARLFHIPVLLDGYPCCASAAILKSLREDSLDHCVIAHKSDERSHARLIAKLNIGQPLLDLKMRLGEGSGAALAVCLVRAAVSCHSGMASFADAGVSERGSSSVNYS